MCYRRGQGKELIYAHKSMGKVLIPCVTGQGFRWMSSCKVILFLSQLVRPHSTLFRSKVNVADTCKWGVCNALCNSCEYSCTALD